MDTILRWVKYGWFSKNRLRGSLVFLFLFLCIFQIISEGFKTRLDFQALWFMVVLVLLVPEFVQWLKNILQRYKEI